MYSLTCVILWLTICPFLEASENHDASKNIWNWWYKEVSATKPLKCKLNPGFSESYPDFINEKFYQESNRNVVVRSRYCKENEDETVFDFKGKILDGQFEGAGKLKIIKIKYKEEKEEVENVGNKICIDLTNNDIVEITGTFKNGVLHGPGKLSMKDKSFIIAHFQNGGFGGLVREFSSNGTLKSIQFLDIEQKGDTWSVTSDGQFLRYRQNQGIYRPQEIDWDALYIPLNSTKKVLAGIETGYQYLLLTNIYTVELESWNFDHCLPELKIKKIQKQSYDLENFLQVLTPFESKESLCQKANVNFHGYINYLQTIPFQSASLLYRVKPETRPVEENKVKQPFLSQIKMFQESSIVKLNMSVWNGPISTWTLSHGGFDNQLNLNGFTILIQDKKFHNKSGSHDFLDWSPSKINGHFKHGKLEGIAHIQTWRLQSLVATFNHGVMHGPAVLHGVVPILDMEKRGFKISTSAGTQGISFIGYFKNGQVFGNVWIQMRGNGWLHGQVDDNGLLSGDDIAYIYPDGETAFKGHFENRYMKKAHHADVLKYGCNDDGLLKVEEYTKPLSNDVFYYDPPTNISFGGGRPALTVLDPYEVKTVRLAQSAQPNGGQGVFLIKDAPAKRFVSMYSLFLYRIPDQQSFYAKNCHNNITKSDEYRRGCKKYSLHLSTYEASIDLPPEFDVNPLPNLGPKVNHHFSAKNSAYMEIEHPRWGMMQSVTLSKDLKAGQELFTYYGYGKSSFPEDFPWYHEAKLLHEREERLKKEAAEKKKKTEKKTKKKKSAK